MAFNKYPSQSYSVKLIGQLPKKKRERESNIPNRFVHIIQYQLKPMVPSRVLYASMRMSCHLREEEKNKEHSNTMLGHVINKRKIGRHDAVIWIENKKDSQLYSFVIHEPSIIHQIKVNQLVQLFYDQPLDKNGITGKETCSPPPIAVVTHVNYYPNVDHVTSSSSSSSSSSLNHCDEYYYSYAMLLYPSVSNEQTIFLNGEYVWVIMGGKLYARAMVNKHIDNNDSDSPYAGRYQIQYLKDQSIYHCKAENLVKIYHQPSLLHCKNYSHPTIVICKSTKLYRRLAQTQVNTCINNTCELVIEIGSALGHATHLIHSQLNHNIKCQVIGIDKSEEFVRQSKHNYPDIEFICMDVLSQKDAFLQLINEKKIQLLTRNEKSSTTEALGIDNNGIVLKVFVDINGNRLLRTVLAILKMIQDDLKPDLTIVKSEELYMFQQNKS
jgi:hypothetical protein